MSATFISDDPIYDPRYPSIGGQDPTNPNGVVFPTGYMLFRDGTRYRIEAGRATMRDRNGNMMKFDFVPGANNLIITDSINRQITVNRIGESFMQWREEITYSGAGGSPRTIIIRVRRLRSIQQSD